jgi:hypothetical protein
MFGQYYRHEEGTEYDLFTCHECGNDFTVDELDASSAYRQARIDSDPVAERVRAAAKRQRERERQRRRDLQRALRTCRRRMDAFAPGWQEAQNLLLRLVHERQRASYDGGPWQYMRIGIRVQALNRAAALRRERAFIAWPDHHRSAMDTVRTWSMHGPERQYRGLPQ